MQLLKVWTSDALPVELDDVKLDLRVDSDDDDDTLERMIRGAASFLERKSGFALIPGRFEALFSEWPCRPVEILRAPLRDLETIAYLSAADTWTEVDTADFQISRRKRSFMLSPLPAFSAPTLFTCLDSVRVRFEAGFDVNDTGVSGESFPLEDGMRSLLIALVGHFYQNRELFAANKIGQIEQGAVTMLGAYRQIW